jgi:peroxiredoxin Q/BCP
VKRIACSALTEPYQPPLRVLRAFASKTSPGDFTEIEPALQPIAESARLCDETPQPRRIAMTKTLLALVAASLLATPALAALPVGAPAPEITGTAYQNGDGRPFSLDASLKKGPVVLYFFPGAFTGGCNIEAHEFADNIDKFKAEGATVIGVTGYFGTTARLSPAQGGLEQAVKDFSKEHCNGKFPVAAVTKETIAAYDVPLTAHPEISNRTSFVITPDRKVLFVYSAMDPSKHVDETTDALKAWRANHPQ